MNTYLIFYTSNGIERSAIAYADSKQDALSHFKKQKELYGNGDEQIIEIS